MSFPLDDQDPGTEERASQEALYGARGDLYLLDSESRGDGGRDSSGLGLLAGGVAVSILVIVGFGGYRLAQSLGYLNN